jgi:hypothetical protein
MKKASLFKHFRKSLLAAMVQVLRIYWEINYMRLLLLGGFLNPSRFK